jgi:hypothetical protein
VAWPGAAMGRGLSVGARWRGALGVLVLLLCPATQACKGGAGASAGDATRDLDAGLDGGGDGGADAAGPDAADTGSATDAAEAGPERDADSLADADADSLADADADADAGADSHPDVADSVDAADADGTPSADATPDSEVTTAPALPIYCETMPKLLAVMVEKEPSADLTPVEVWFPACSAAPPTPMLAKQALPPAIEDAEIVVSAATRSDVIWAGIFSPAPAFEDHPLTLGYREFAAGHARASGPLPWKAQLEQMIYEEAHPPAPTPKPLDFASLRSHLIHALGLELPLAELAARPVRFALGPWQREIRVVDGKVHRFEWADIAWSHELLGAMDGMIARPVDPVDSPAPAVLMEHGHDLPDLRFLPLQPDPSAGGIHQWLIEFGGRELAERGYVVFASATRSFLSYEQQTALLLTEHTETPLLGLMVLETLTKVAILNALPFVDPARVGGLGHSAGGHRLRATAAVLGSLPIAVDYGFSAYTSDPPSILPHCETIPQAAWIQSPMQELARFPFPMLVFGYHYAPCTEPCGGATAWLPRNGLQTPPVTREVLRDFFDISLKHASPN